MESYLRRLDFEVDLALPVSRDHDRLVNDHKVEIKFSTLWEQGDFAFQQLRDQDYEYVVLLGVLPAAAQAWIVPKDEVFARATPQHGGSRGTDTRWLRFRAKSAPAWMADYGGDLDAFEATLHRLV